MKTRSNPFLLLALSLSACASLPAAVLYWDGTDTNADANGGAGTWDTTTTNWDSAATAGSSVAWPASSTGDDDALFGGAAGSVTVDAGGVTVNDITFSIAGYALSGGTLNFDNLDPDGGGPLTAPLPVINAGPTSHTQSATINSKIVSSSGLEKKGGSTVSLGGDLASLSGTILINGGVVSSPANNNSGFTLANTSTPPNTASFDIRNNNFLALGGVTVGSGVSYTLAGGGGYNAPQGAIRGTAGTNVVQGAVSIADAAVRLGNTGTSITFAGPITAPPLSGFGLTLRIGLNQGVTLSNTSNSWEGLTTLGEGTFYFHPGALPNSTNLLIAGSNNTWFESNGTFTRSAGTAAGQVQFNATANRINGFSARGGDLSVNLGGAVSPAPLVWGAAGFVPGALGLSSTNATGTVTWLNAIDLGAATRTIDCANGSAEVDARISASLSNGGMTKTGNGTLALAAANTFTVPTLTMGAASADRGAIRIENGAALSGITLVDMNSAVNSSARARIELLGGVSVTGVDIRTGGRGDVAASGVALANLSGNNTWGGVIRISNTGGSYGIRSDADTLTLSGTLQNGIGSARDWTLGGAGNIRISGNVVNGSTGGLSFTKHGEGTLILSGAANTFTLGGTVAGGTLQIGEGGTTGSFGTGSVINNATLVFDRDGTLNVPGAVSGSGVLINRGPGVVTLNGALSHSGGIQIQNGSLLIGANSSAATGDVTVGDGTGAASSAVLGGVGPLGGTVTLSTDGAIAPGLGVGSLELTGTVSGTGGLLVEIDGSTADKLTASGSLDISGLSLSLSQLAAPSAPVYVIVDAASPITGAAFAAVSGVPSGYTLTYNYNDGVDSNNIALVQVGTPFTLWASGNGLAGGNASPTADPDNDGLDNAVEFVIGGQPNPANPNATSNSLAPVADASGSNLVFSFRSTDLAQSQPGIAIQAEYGSSLSGWTPAVHGVNGVSIVTTQDGYGAGVDKVDVTIPKALATGSTLFVRLNVSIP